jgi:hypothetical protein
MSRSRIKNFSYAFTAVVMALSLTACAAGPNAETRKVKKVTDGAEIMIKSEGNNISVTNLLLVATEDGSAVVVGTIINYLEERDALLGISVNNIGATITGEQNLDQNVPLRFEGELATSKAVFSGVGAEAGNNVKLSLAFARAGVVTANVIIRDKRDDYAEVTP